jgi:hypothetical protein
VTRSFSLEAAETDHETAEECLGRERDEQYPRHDATEGICVRELAIVQAPPRPEDIGDKERADNVRAYDKRPPR